MKTQALRLQSGSAASRQKASFAGWDTLSLRLGGGLDEKGGEGKRGPERERVAQRSGEFPEELPGEEARSICICETWQDVRTGTLETTVVLCVAVVLPNGRAGGLAESSDSSCESPTHVTAEVHDNPATF